MKQAELIRIKCRDYSQTKDIQDVWNFDLYSKVFYG